MAPRAAQTEPEVSAGGIFLPTAAAEMEADNRSEGMQEFDLAERKPLRSATVVAMGPGWRSDDGYLAEMGDVSVGQKVILGPYGGVKADPQDSDSSLYLIEMKDIWATSK